MKEMKTKRRKGEKEKRKKGKKEKGKRKKKKRKKRRFFPFFSQKKTKGKEGDNTPTLRSCKNGFTFRKSTFNLPIIAD